MSPSDAGPAHGRRGRIVTTAVVLIAVGLFLYPLRWIILPFVVAGVAAYVCTTPIEWMTRRTQLPRSLFAALAFIVLMAIASAFAAWSAPALIRELAAVVGDFSGTIKTLMQTTLGERPFDLFGYRIDPRQLTELAATNINHSMQGIDLFSVVIGAVGGVFGLFLTVALLLYLLLSGPALAKGAFWLVPPRHRALVARMWSRLDPILKRYFVGVLVVVGYATIAAYVGLGLILGLRHAVLLALLTGILEMIPVIGPGAAAVMAGLVAVHYSEGWGPIAAFAIYATVLRLSIDQLVGPLVLGQAARLHPVMIIFCFLAGAALFGIAGVMLSVPAALAIRSILVTLYDDEGV
jgi:predicted PurR-regulated permease PerM